MRTGLLLLLVAVVAYWPGLGAASWVGTEGRRVEIAREMAATGGLIVPTLGLEPTLAKPPLYYWLLAPVISAFGTSQLAVRGVSVLALWLGAWLAFAVLRRSHGASSAWLGALGMLCAPMLLHHGSMAEIDPLFAALTAGSVLLLGHAIAFGGRWAFAGAGLLGAAALLTKGPPYFVFLAGPLWACVRTRAWRGLPWYVVPLLVPPLAYYAVLNGHPAAATLGDVALSETVERAFTWNWSQIVDIGPYFVRSALACLPFLLFVRVPVRANDEATRRAELQRRCCTISAVTSVVVLAASPGHAMRYLLPSVLLCTVGLAPRVAAWLGGAHDEFARGTRALLRVLGVLGGVALVALPFMAVPPLPGRAPVLALALGLLPLLATTRRRVVMATLVLPVLAAWTVLADRTDHLGRTARSSVAAGTLVRETLAAHGADDVATFGHFDYAHLFEVAKLVPGDERCARAPTTRFLLVEHRGADRPRPEGYADRVHIHAHDRQIVLLERSE